MSKFTFICDHELPLKPAVSLAKITYESNRESLEDVIADFQDFLKGCGFNFDGRVGIVEDDIIVTPAHNQHFYDTDRNR